MGTGWRQPGVERQQVFQVIAHPSGLQAASQFPARWPAGGARCHSEEPRGLFFSLEGLLVMGGATKACSRAAVLPLLVSRMPPYSRMLAPTFADPSAPRDGLPQGWLAGREVAVSLPTLSPRVGRAWRRGGLVCGGGPRPAPADSPAGPPRVRARGHPSPGALFSCSELRWGVYRS